MPQQKQISQNSVIKQIIFGAVFLVFSLLFWIFASWSFKNTESEFLSFGLGIFAGYFLFLLVFGSLAALTDFLIDKIWLAILIYFLSVAISLFFFPLKFWIFVAALILFIILIWGYFRVKSEKEDRIKFGVTKLACNFLPIFMTGVILLLSCVYYYSLAKEMEANGIKIPRKTFDRIINPLKKVIPSFIPGFSEKASVKEIIYLYTINQFGKNMGGSGQENEMRFPPELMNVLQKEGVDLNNKEALSRALTENPQVKKEVMKFFEAQESGNQENDLNQTLKEWGMSENEPIFDALHKAVNQKINEVAGPYMKYLAILFALMFFVSFKFISIFIVWLIYPFTWILIKILIMLKFVKLEKEQKMVEVIRL